MFQGEYPRLSPGDPGYFEDLKRRQAMLNTQVKPPQVPGAAPSPIASDSPLTQEVRDKLLRQLGTAAEPPKFPQGDAYQTALGVPAGQPGGAPIRPGDPGGPAIPTWKRLIAAGLAGAGQIAARGQHAVNPAGTIAATQAAGDRIKYGDFPAQQAQYMRDMAQKTAAAKAESERARLSTDVRRDEAQNALNTAQGFAALTRPSSVSQALKGVPGVVAADDIADRVKTDATGQPIQKGSGRYYRIQTNASGQIVTATPSLAVTSRMVMPDADSPTGFSVALLDYQGNPTGKIMGAAAPPAYAPMVTSGISMQTDQNRGIVAIPTTTTIQRQPSANPVTPLDLPQRGAQRNPMEVGPPVAQPQASPGAPRAGVGVPIPTGIVRPAPTNIVTARDTMNTAIQSFDKLAAQGDALFTSNGPFARTGGVTNRVNDFLGRNPIATKYINTLNALRPALGRTVGGDVGNLSVQEQEWAIKRLGSLGNRKDEWDYFKNSLQQLLKSRRDLAQNIIEGKLDEASAHVVMARQATDFEQAMQESAGPAQDSPIREQKNNRTGQFRHTLDGGKTWRPGKAPTP